MVTLNDMQRAVLQDYATGDFAYLIADPPRDLSALGDTLLSFILIELSENEDCEGVEDAIRRLKNGQDDLEQALASLRALLGTIDGTAVEVAA